MKRFASTRSDRLASQPGSGRAQCSVGSIEEDGIRYGLTTQALIASTIAIAPATVTIQSIAIRHGRGSRYVNRSIGFLERRRGGGCGPATLGVEPRPPHGIAQAFVGLLDLLEVCRRPRRRRVALGPVEADQAPVR